MPTSTWSPLTSTAPAWPGVGGVSGTHHSVASLAVWLEQRLPESAAEFTKAKPSALTATERALTLRPPVAAAEHQAVWRHRDGELNDAAPLGQKLRGVSWTASRVASVDVHRQVYVAHGRVWDTSVRVLEMLHEPVARCLELLGG